MSLSDHTASEDNRGGGGVIVATVRAVDRIGTQRCTGEVTITRSLRCLSEVEIQSKNNFFRNVILFENIGIAQQTLYSS